MQNGTLEDMEYQKYEVTATSHDLLKRGITEAETVYVGVMADTYAEGATLAAQVVACTSPYGYVTGVYPYY